MRNSLSLDVLNDSNSYYLGVCVIGEVCVCGGGGGGGFLDILTAECVAETFTLHSYKGKVRKAYS